MAEGGKPLADAKIRISVDGSDKVRAELVAVAKSAKEFANTSSKALTDYDKAMSSIAKKLGDQNRAQEAANAQASIYEQTQKKIVAAVGERLAAERRLNEELAVAQTRAAGLAREQASLRANIAELGEAERRSATTYQNQAVQASNATTAFSGLNARFAATNESIKGVVGGGLRLVGTITRVSVVAGAAAAAVGGLASGFKRLADEINGVQSGKGSDAAVQFMLDAGVNAARASQDVGELERAYAALTDRLGELAQERNKALNAKEVSEAKQLAAVWKEMPALIEAARQAEESRASKAAVQRDIEIARAEARAIIEAEKLATMTEEERHLARIAALEKARAVQQGIGGSAAEIQAIIDRINAERDARIAAEKAVEDAKNKADEDRAKEQEKRDKERIDKEIAARKKAAEDEANARIRAQQSVFDAARRESERSLQAIAVTTAQATQLLRAINTSQSGGGTPWQS